MNWFLRGYSCSSWFIPYLKKQSQFLKGQNERNTSYNKELYKINAIGHLVKTNPNKANLFVLRTP